MKSQDQDRIADVLEMASNRTSPDRREEVEQFLELMAHLQQVFWIKNAADDAVLYVSPAYETICGRTSQSLYENFQTFLDAVHPEDRDRVAMAMAGQHETGGYEEEYRIVRPDGTIRWIWARSYPVRDEHGLIIRFAGIGEDITERKALELDRARLAAIVEYSEDAIVSMSTDCIIISWNRGAELQYGYTAEEIIGCPLSVLFPPDHYREYLRVLQNVRKGKPVECCDTVRQKKDGTIISTSVKIFPIQVRNRETAGASNISRDITAIKNMEAHSIKAQKMEVVGQLAAGMVHDFNNILLIIMGHTGLMMAALSSNSPMLKGLETIQQATTRAAALTSQLLVFCRKKITTPVVLDLGDIVADLDKILRALIDRNIDLTIVRGQQSARVRADTGLLGQVLLNLAINARDAMPDGGRLTIATSTATLTGDDEDAHQGVPPGIHALLSISDTGTGMTETVKAHLFEPLFTTKLKGTGLGLATSSTIVKQFSGHIIVQSELGKGTTFRVYFPAVCEPLDDSIEASSTGRQMPTGTETVLVVENEPPVRRLVCSVLESLGYTVLQAINGLDGLRVARTYSGKPVRLVITDINMPQVPGNLAVEWSTLPCPDIRFLFTPGYAGDAIAHHGIPAERIEFLQKPFTPAQLAFKVRKMLDRGNPGHTP